MSLSSSSGTVDPKIWPPPANAPQWAQPYSDYLSGPIPPWLSQPARSRSVRFSRRRQGWSTAAGDDLRCVGSLPWRVLITRVRRTISGAR